MNWSDLSTKEQTLIDSEDAQFISDINARPEVKYVLSMNPSLGSVLSAVKGNFISSYSPPPNTKKKHPTLDAYQKHAQIQYNIYFRYGCELIHFCNNPNLQPIVMIGKEYSLVVPYDQKDCPFPEDFERYKNGEEDCLLPEYFTKYKNRLAPPTRDDKEKQKEKFDNIMAYNFLRGEQRHFFRIFNLVESPNYSISLEQLYFSYYIAWKELMEHFKSTQSKPSDEKQISHDSINLIKTGQDFLNEILFKHPVNKFKHDINFDFIEYILFGYKDYKKKREIAETYFEIPSFVYQRHPHTFPVFETTFQNDTEVKGLLYQIKFELSQLKKMTPFFITLEDDDYRDLMEAKREIEDELGALIRNQESSTKIKYAAEKYLRSLGKNSVYNLLKDLMICCRFEPIKNKFQSIVEIYNKKTHYENITHTIDRLSRKVAVSSPDVFSQYESEEGYGILDTENNETEKIKIEINKDEIIEEGNHNLILFFKDSFMNGKKLSNLLQPEKFLRKIEEYLKIDSINFRYDLYGYLDLNETASSKLQKIYESVLKNQGITICQDHKNKFNDKIKDEILLPMVVENFILYGPVRLKNIYIFFFNDEKFTDSIGNLIDDSFKEFEKNMYDLSKRFGNHEKESHLRNEYHEALYTDRKDMPPFIDELELRKAINEFINKKASKSGGFWKLRNTYLLSFPCYSRRKEWKDLLFKIYTGGKKVNPKTETYFKTIIREITYAINKEEIIRYGKV